MTANAKNMIRHVIDMAVDTGLMAQNLGEVAASELQQDIQILGIRVNSNRYAFNQLGNMEVEDDRRAQIDSVAPAFGNLILAVDALSDLPATQIGQGLDAVRAAGQALVTAGRPIAQDIVGAIPDEDEEYMLLETVDAAGELTSIEAEGVIWRVSLARPEPGSLTRRIREDKIKHDSPEEACLCFLERMSSKGLPGVLDTPEIREFHSTREDFEAALTEALFDSMDDIPEEDARDDDMDNMPLSQLREAMVDANAQLDAADGPTL